MFRFLWLWIIKFLLSCRSTKRQVDGIKKLTVSTAQAFPIYISFTPVVSGNPIKTPGTLLDAGALRMSSIPCCRAVMNMGSEGRWAWVCILARTLLNCMSWNEVFQLSFSLCAELYPTPCDPVDCSPPGSSVHGILQARILEWIAISSSRGSSWDRTWVSWVSCIGSH